jgi:hypothetical protein
MNNLLKDLYPDLCEWWHPDNTLSIETATCGSKIKVKWQCPISEDHIWTTSIAAVVRYKSCPYCSGQKVAPSTSLKTNFPEVCKLWHPILNKLTPENVSVSSARKV